MSFRSVVGSLITVIWLAGGAYYAFFFISPAVWKAMSPNEMGDFAAGFFAPLAFFWLVLGYAQQGEELIKNNEEMRRQYEEMKKSAEQAEIQARSISANELHARRDVFVQLKPLIEARIEVICGKIAEIYKENMEIFTFRETKELQSSYLCRLILQDLGNSLTGTNLDVMTSNLLKDLYEKLHANITFLFHEACQSQENGGILTLYSDAEYHKLYELIGSQITHRFDERFLLILRGQHAN